VVWKFSARMKWSGENQMARTQLCAEDWVRFVLAR
jgi:hypothetical protein